MRYSRFEALALVLGSVAIVASVFLSTVTPDAVEVTAQLLLILVLAGALHRGRNGGFITALIAVAIYVVMRVPMLRTEGLTPDILTGLGIRALTYAVVGVIGGELASRVKYLFTRFENETLVDPVTGAYSRRYAAGAIFQGLARWRRYHTEYSVARVVISPQMFLTLKPAHSRQLMRQVAGYVRNDIRMVDDLAIEDTGVFLVLLTGTDPAGATVVCNRLVSGVRALLDAPESAVTGTVLSASSETQALEQLATTLDPEAVAIPTAPTGHSLELESGVTASDQEPIA